MHFSSGWSLNGTLQTAQHLCGFIIKFLKLIRPIKTIKSQKDFLGHLVQVPSYIK